MKLLKFNAPTAEVDKHSGLVVGASIFMCDCGNSSLALRFDDPNCENGLSVTCKNCFQTYYMDTLMKEFKEENGN